MKGAHCNTSRAPHVPFFGLVLLALRPIRGLIQPRDRLHGAAFERHGGDARPAFAPRTGATTAFNEENAMKETLILCSLVLFSGVAMAQADSDAGAIQRIDSTMPPAEDFSVPTPPLPPVQVETGVSTSSRAAPVSDDSKFATMDANANGSLSKNEVTVNSELVTRFRALDKNSDGKLSRSEYGMRNVDPSQGR